MGAGEQQLCYGNREEHRKPEGEPSFSSHGEHSATAGCREARVCCAHTAQLLFFTQEFSNCSQDTGTPLVLILLPSRGQHNKGTGYCKSICKEKRKRFSKVQEETCSKSRQTPARVRDGRERYHQGHHSVENSSGLEEAGRKETGTGQPTEAFHVHVGCIYHGDAATHKGVRTWGATERPAGLCQSPLSSLKPSAAHSSAVVLLPRPHLKNLLVVVRREPAPLFSQGTNKSLDREAQIQQGTPHKKKKVLKNNNGYSTALPFFMLFCSERKAVL